MNLYSKLRERQSSGSPLRVGMIGAGKFGSMYLAQVPRTPGVHLAGVVDLSPAAARRNLARVGGPLSRYGASSLDDALKMGTTYVSDDYQELIAHPRIEIIIECTGNPVAAVEHCLAGFRGGKHIVNVTVEADAFCGVLLALKAQQAGVIYSLAYGDQPGSLAIWSIGRARAVSRSWRQVVVTNGCRSAENPHPILFGNSGASQRSRPSEAVSIPRCLIHSWTGQSQLSKAQRSRTRQVSKRRRRD